jgi:hypothetical protein
MQRYYRFAGVEYAIAVEKNAMFPEERTLAPFRVPSAENPHLFRIEKVDTLPEPAGKCIVQEPALQIYAQGQVQWRYSGSVRDGLKKAYLCARHEGKDHRVYVKRDVFPESVSTKVILEAMEAEHLIARAGGFVFHCSYIDWQGKGILFTAPSETGKSTQAELWNQLRGAEIINGDRAAVRIEQDAIFAEGIPFSGSSVYCHNRSLPLAAVVYLAQAPVTTIRRLRGYEAFARIWEGCSINTWDREDMASVSESVRRVAETIPIFHMPCRPDETAVLALEKALKEVGQ